MKKSLFLFFFLFLPLIGLEAIPKKEHRISTVASAVNSLGLVPTIVIDAGHGGLNLGAHVRQPFCEEKRITLLTALYMKKYLNQLGYRVVMTRNSDAFVPLPRRVEIANKARADLFISIHYNSSRIPSAQGIEVFFSDVSDDQNRSVLSRKLAGSILTRIVRRTHAPSRGVKKANFLVIRETNMPAVLVEGGFISNPQERAFLKDPLYLDKVARGIVEGIDHYLNSLLDAQSRSFKSG
jgi:N-acetylmuramoyl-L-alanine amidase